MTGFRTSGWGFWVAGGLFAFGLTSCSSGSEQQPLPHISSAKAERDVVDGQAKLTSSVKVTFDREFKVVPGDVPFASNFEFTVPLAEGGTQRVLVKTADVAGGTGRVIELKVDALLPQEATLKVRRSTFQAKATGTIETKVDSDLDKTLVLLASKALTPSNDSFLGEPETAAVKPEDRDDAAMRLALEAHMQQRQADPQTVQDALDLYGAIPQDIVTSPKLRAALAALTGTFAEPAISSLLTANNCTKRPASKIAFQLPPDNPKLLARVTYVGNGARVISINPYAEGERIEHLMPILAHEAIHCDQEDGLVEEVAATAFDGFLYLQLVAANEELAQAHTRVARELNVDAVGLINSGALVPESVGILPSVGVKSILPGSNVTAGSFAEFVVRAYPDIGQNTSPTEPLAATYASILAEVAGMPAGDAFDLRYLDELLSRAMNGRVLLTAITAF
ncbi:MAG: hypothetical protein ABI577_18060, partial [bacterium]